MPNFRHTLPCTDNSGVCLPGSQPVGYCFGISTRQKRMRTSFKHHQLRAMKAYFNINHNPDVKDLKVLTEKTGLSKRVLQVWFQNARAKYRRSLLRQETQTSGTNSLITIPNGSVTPSKTTSLLNPQEPDLGQSHHLESTNGSSDCNSKESLLDISGLEAKDLSSTGNGTRLWDYEFDSDAGSSPEDPVKPTERFSGSLDALVETQQSAASCTSITSSRTESIQPVNQSTISQECPSVPPGSYTNRSIGSALLPTQVLFQPGGTADSITSPEFPKPEDSFATNVYFGLHTSSARRTVDSRPVNCFHS